MAKPQDFLSFAAVIGAGAAAMRFDPAGAIGAKPHDRAATGGPAC